MTNNNIHQALSTLYQVARKAPVNADDGDVRENCVRILNTALLEAYPPELPTEPEVDNSEVSEEE